MSDLVSVECPNCGAPLKVKEAGDEAREVRCPKCKEAFVVEAREDEPPTARKKRAPVQAEEDDSPRPRRRGAPPREEDEDDSTPLKNKRRGARAREEDEEEGRTGKRKKKQKAGRSQLVLLGIAAGVGVLVLCGIVLAVVLMPHGKKMTAPDSFATYDAPEGEFACLVPADWKLQEAGIKNTRSITVKKGSASIHIRQSLAGSLLGDIAGAGERDANVPDERLPVSRVHDLKKAGVAEEFSKYQEEAPTTVMTKSFGKARRSAFTCSGTFGGKKRGYRATVLANMISYDIICQCSEADWAVLEPAFAKVIASLGH
jgi:predicted Zn finger-like uncharacterized protein